MRLLYGIALTLLLSLSAERCAAATELMIQSRAKIEIQWAVYPAINHDDFALLETMADTYRSQRTTTDAGERLLRIFYDVFIPFAQAYVQDEGYRKDWDRKMEKWRTLYPRSPTPIILQARMLYFAGSAVRGDGFAQNVWQDDMIEFTDKLKAARKILEVGKAIADSDPQWYCAMIGIHKGLGSQWPAIQALVAEAVAKDTGYFDIFYAPAIYLQPRWYGSPEALDVWADYAAKATAATEGDTLYARIYLITAESLGNAMQLEAKPDLPRLKASMIELTTKYPAPAFYQRAHELACHFGDGDWVRERMRLWLVNSGSTRSDVTPNGWCAQSIAEKEHKQPFVFPSQRPEPPVTQKANVR